MPRLVVIPMASPLHDEAARERIIARHRPLFERLGGVIVAEPGDPELVAVPADAGGRTDVAVPFVLTGGTEAQIIDWFERSGRAPILLATHPSQNSLPAALEGLARVQQLGGRGEIVYLDDPDDAAGAAALSAAVHRFETRAALAGTRLGLVGDPSDWLVASNPSPASVSRTWGPTIVPIPVERMVSASAARHDDRLGRSMVDDAAGVSVTIQRIDAATGVASALDAIVEAERLDALTVRCFDLIDEAETTGCLALSRLNDQGIVAGCEGDLPSAIAMLWLRTLTGAPTWMANPARVDRRRGTILLAHCTVPRSMVDGYRLDSHFESGHGVGIAGVIPNGPCTLVRIGGVELDRAWIVDAEIIGTGSHPDLCRTQIEVDVGADRVDELLRRPLGNHIVMAPGHHARALTDWFDVFVA